MPEWMRSFTRRSIHFAPARQSTQAPDTGREREDDMSSRRRAAVMYLIAAACFLIAGIAGLLGGTKAHIAFIVLSVAFVTLALRFWTSPRESNDS